MAAQREKTLTWREATASETMPFVLLAAQFAMPQDDSQAHEIAQAGRCYVVEENGVAVAGYTLRQFGSELFVTAYGGRAEVDLSKVLAAIIEVQAANFETIGFKTTRRGLVRKAQAQGYEIAGYIMRKKVKK